MAGPLSVIGQKLDLLEQELKCVICLSVFDEPHSLPCNHMFCRECISEFFRQKSQCPLCKLPTIKRAIIKNQTLVNVIAAYHGLREALENSQIKGLPSPSPKKRPIPVPATPPDGNKRPRRSLPMNDSPATPTTPKGCMEFSLVVQNTPTSKPKPETPRKIATRASTSTDTHTTHSDTEHDNARSKRKRGEVTPTTTASTSSTTTTPSTSSSTTTTPSTHSAATTPSTTSTTSTVSTTPTTPTTPTLRYSTRNITDWNSLKKVKPNTPTTPTGNRNNNNNSNITPPKLNLPKPSNTHNATSPKPTSPPPSKSPATPSKYGTTLFYATGNNVVSPSTKLQNVVTNQRNGIPNSTNAVAKQGNSAANGARGKSKCKKVVVLATSIDKELTAEAKTILKELGGSLVSKYSSDVTHIVAGLTRPFCARRTIKYCMGVAQGKWVVSIDWLTQSRAAKYFLNEQSFEVAGDTVTNGGPQSAREAIAKKEDPLFTGWNVFLLGTFTSPSKNEFKRLLQLAGAEVSSKIKPKKGKATNTSDVLVYAPQSFSYLPKEEVARLKREGRTVVDARWILDCVSHYRVLPSEEYELNAA